MYEYIEGELVELTTAHAVVNVGGIGYKLLVPVTLFGQQIGKKTRFYTSWVVREMSQTLFGFLSKQERDLFETLITLSGIGPKTGLSMIGHLSMSEMRRAVQTQNAALLARVPGIGKKTAERLLVDLKNKCFDALPVQAPDQLSDALQALLNLGYSQAAAQKAVQLAAKEVGDSSDTPTLISAALRFNK